MSRELRDRSGAGGQAETAGRSAESKWYVIERVVAVESYGVGERVDFGGGC